MISDRRPETTETKVAEFTGATEFQRGPETSLFTVPEAVVQRAKASFYDVEPRDERFLMVRAVEGATAPRLMLVQTSSRN